MKALFLTDRGAQLPTADSLQQISILLNSSYDDILNSKYNRVTDFNYFPNGHSINFTDKNYNDKLITRMNSKRFQMKLQQKTYEYAPKAVPENGV